MAESDVTVRGARSSADEVTPVLQLIDVSKSFAAKVVLSRVSLTVQPGEIHALLGQNGSGKSTLIKILSGYHLPDAGSEVMVAGELLHLGSPAASNRSGCRFVHQDLGLIGGESVLNNLAIGNGYPTRFGTIRQRSARRRATESLARVGLDISPDRTLSSLSPAEQTGVAVARAMDVTAGPARLLVMDEPTATLPADEVQRLLTMLRSTAATGVGIIYVSHHLSEIFQVADRVTVLRDGHQVGTMPIGQIDRDGLVHMLLGVELENAERAEAAAVVEEREVAPRLVIRDLAAGSVAGVSFAANEGDVIGIHGLTGSGRETVLGAIFGAVPRTSGDVLVDGQPVPPARPRAAITARIGYMPPDRGLHGGVMTLTARENFSLVDVRPYWNRFVLSRAKERSDGEEWFEKLDIRPRGSLDAPLSSFSGGNQQKILLAKWLRTKPRVLLLDDPTQGVDIGAKVGIHKQILAAAAYGAAVVVSSTDEDELIAICSQVLVIHGGRIVDVLRGDRINDAQLNRALHASVARDLGLDSE